RSLYSKRAEKIRRHLRCEQAFRFADAGQVVKAYVVGADLLEHLVSRSPVGEIQVRDPFPFGQEFRVCSCRYTRRSGSSHGSGLSTELHCWIDRVSSAANQSVARGIQEGAELPVRS